MLLFGRQHGFVVEERLLQEGVDPNRSAVNALYFAQAFQLVQVSSDGGGRYPQASTGLLDADYPALADQLAQSV